VIAHPQLKTSTRKQKKVITTISSSDDGTMKNAGGLLLGGEVISRVATMECAPRLRFSSGGEKGGEWEGWVAVDLVGRGFFGGGGKG